MILKSNTWPNYKRVILIYRQLPHASYLIKELAGLIIVRKKKENLESFTKRVN